MKFLDKIIDKLVNRKISKIRKCLEVPKKSLIIKHIINCNIDKGGNYSSMDNISDKDFFYNTVFKKYSKKNE